MTSAWILRLAHGARAHGWWIAPQVVIAVVLSIILGLWGVWFFYAALNSLLVWFYSDHAGPNRKRKRQLTLKILAAVFVPVGFLISIGRPTPSKLASHDSPDIRVRRATDKSGLGPRGWR